MPQQVHTYGQTCHLARNVSFSGAKITDDIPHLKAQYFYYATYSVDDPLSAVPIPTGSESEPPQYPPLPFSARDNNALEEAWLGVATDKDKKLHKHTKYGFGAGKGGNEGGFSKIAVVGDVVGHDGSNDAKSFKNGQSSKNEEDAFSADARQHSTKQAGTEDLSCYHDDHYISSSRKDEPGTEHSDFDPQQRPSCCEEPESSSSSPGSTENDMKSKPRKEKSKLGLLRGRQRHEKPQGDAADDISSRTTPLDIKKSSMAVKPQSKRAEAEPKSGSLASDSIPSSLPLHIGSAGTTGLPFVKLPSRSTSPRPRSSHLEAFGHEERQTSEIPAKNSRKASPTKGHERDSTEIAPADDHECKSHKNTKEHSDVPVGVSRLYLVELPALLMKPIYWAHVHDTAPIVRATWFYKDTMLPVEPVVANQLEMGYRELRPWSQTWSDELSSAVEVGAAGEEKIVHRLWPKDEKPDPKKHLLSADPQCAARCFQGEAAAEGSLEAEPPASSPRIIKKKYPNSQVIYKDALNAFILKPNLQPSAYYGRKPLQKIRKGWPVGIQVIRGFDRNAWEKLHPPKKSVAASKAAAKVPVSGDVESANADVCPACKLQDETPNVTDLCLVIHGIGQKLSERVESFNFTHACNSVRRSVNVELGTEAVKKVLRKDLGGIMVLPINWRSNLSFDDGGPRKDGDKEDNASDFTLKEITPDTIPAVRNLISDVMLDIPFYMSHHKEKMIQAVVHEANRVYRLWCKNNPDFHTKGRVHIIAHSLGSAMALEILSKQPTHISSLDLRSKKLNTRHFDFNTTNLFCAGSPCGFFLLLERGRLCPRRGKNKPGAEPGDDQDGTIVGEAGTFGCLSVDNIYNIMHCNDPVAYRLNATVDPAYAAALKEAHVPSATTGFFEGIGNAMKSVTPGLAAPVDLAVGQVAKPTIVARLPSQLEMAIHDFTREEIAEKKFYLLNDNCQIDWLLNSGGGPFDIAYFDMLGAHSSYWEKKEFIRLLVTEVGREPGKQTTLPNMRAVKKAHKV